jgi:hypothetical protein
LTYHPFVRESANAQERGIRDPPESAVQRGNIVGMWQAMMWSSLIGNNCGDFVDGIWGPNTRSRTITWQRRHGLTADGIVGPQTWSHAQSHLVRTGSDAEFIYYEYPGALFTLQLATPRATGVWLWIPPTAGSANNSSHPGIGPNGCA